MADEQAAPSPEPSASVPRAPEPRITDLDALKVFTHPLRIRIYRALFTSREATASRLADQVDEAVSLVSYHLRKLAAHGFIVEAPGRGGDGRERWWKLSSDRGFSFRNSDFDDRPEGVAVLGEVTRQLLATRAERYARYLDGQAAWPRRWTEAAFSSEYMPRLTAAELQEMAEEIGDLMWRWTERGRAAEEAGDTEGREHVAVHMYGFPHRD
ncbi:putative ArsR family transcriptional regulator [Actinacidiphila reveromycinica]|uniref:Putative ArsR family transcriptional regulator n=1 Tax=Actinacidiphila reveromycinica TaxID=659352 RepID=A0A7U3UQ88_9ACTN|nr:helix-turn-helix domain-containing protein [Streptomyces sp. SN-593]BBA96734.1 putative ArsR family transcriptional regulator [Streptomyces sp. SN-593]